MDNSSSDAPVARTRSQPLRASHHAVRSAPVAPARPARPAAAPVAAPYQHALQRLSIEGAHAFALWDCEAGFSLFSANFERVTGLRTGDCAGHDWIYSIHHSHQYALHEALERASQGHPERCLVQARSPGLEESWRWLLVDMKPAIADTPALVLWQDLTDHKALEEALATTSSALALSERSRTAFLSSMSHELRTPLNAIMGFSEMMTNGVFGTLGNPTYAQYAQHIHESGSALLGKINDLLSIASYDAGNMALDISRFPLRALLEEVMEIHSREAFARGHRLHLECPHALEIEADRAKLLCALSHLLSNARRHSPPESEITLSLALHGETHLVLSVRDQGEGIASAQLQAIRAAFEADNAYPQIAAGGIGVGLALTRELVALHGGRLQIDSVRHHGTVASILLPSASVCHGLPAKRSRG